MGGSGDERLPTVTSRRIVLGLDGSEGATRALDWCVEHAPLLDAEVVAVYVIDVALFVPPPSALTPPFTLDDHARDELRAALEDWVAPLRARDIPCRTVLTDGSPAAAIEDVAAREGADLVVVGRRGRGGFAELLLGSTPHSLAHHARRPVLVVPAVHSTG